MFISLLLHCTTPRLSPTSTTRFLNRLFRTSFSLKMESLLKPPEIVRGMTELDRKLFQKEIQVTCLIATGVKVSQILPVVKPYLLKLERFKPIQHNQKETNIFLNPQLVRAWASFPVEVQKALSDLAITEDNLRQDSYTLCYDNYSVENIFRAILPTETEGMSSFTKIGHIVHVNLREHLLPYKNVIGEVLYDKIPGCSSVVNKTNMIDNTYRNFQMEILKGDDDMLTTVKENGCMFKFDFSKVYWNSRLCTEHERIVKMLKEGDVLFDVFAGVGPFSLPIAKKKCHVYANDLNPESYKWLVNNAKANKVDDRYFKPFNKDGKDFIRDDIRELLPLYLRSNQNVYIVMNLPALAVQFLDNFVGLCDDLPEILNPPTIFVYCFAKGVDYVAIARDLVNESFGFDVSDKIIEIFRVRTVSSLKEMMRVAIRLDRDILEGAVSKKRKLDDGLEVGSKKCCVEGKDGEEQEQRQEEN